LCFYYEWSPKGNYLAFIGSSEMPPGIYSSDDNWFYRNPDAGVTTEIFTMDLSDYSIRQVTNGLYSWEGYLRWVE